MTLTLLKRHSQISFTVVISFFHVETINARACFENYCFTEFSKFTRDTIIEICDREYAKFNKCLIMRNHLNDIKTKFNKNYTSFENGFGNRTLGNFWIGLKNLHKLTSGAVGLHVYMKVNTLSKSVTL